MKIVDHSITIAISEFFSGPGPQPALALSPQSNPYPASLPFSPYSRNHPWSSGSVMCRSFLCALSPVSRSCNFVAAAAVPTGRQQFLQGPGGSPKAMAENKMPTSHGLEADAAATILKRITPSLDPCLHKGQAGKVSTLPVQRYM